MKFNGKNLEIFFGGLIFIFSFSFLILPHIIYAQTANKNVNASTASTFENYCTVTPTDVSTGKAIKLNVGFTVPGVIEEVPKGSKQYYVKDMGCYIGGFYKYFAGVGGILAAVMIIFGGYKYITSFGNASRMADAKNTISEALFGVVLLLGSYIILYTINPNLISLRTPDIRSVSTILLDTQWCPSGATPLTDADKGMNCGDKGTIAKAGQKGGECYFGGGCKADEICGLTNGFQLPYVCQNYKQLCEATDSNYCKNIDDEMAAANVIVDVCTKGGALSSNCSIYKANYCSGDWKRVDCNIGGALETPCWKDGKPRWTNTMNATCASESQSPRPFQSNYQPSICCGKVDKTKINCRSVGVCNSDEAPVDCGQYNSDTSKNYQNVGVSCTGGAVCCMELKLTVDSLN